MEYIKGESIVYFILHRFLFIEFFFYLFVVVIFDTFDRGCYSFFLFLTVNDTVAHFVLLCLGNIDREPLMKIWRLALGAL